ncbi:inositol monophosphatase family protein [Pseudonocardia ailaonensis]|uniref:inositol monophosphatase family protein n=1 Tax=Pseudonocardia ailaonensis TaxID=367279 RepID=UPI0031DD1EFC
MPPTLAELLPIATEAVDRAARMIRERAPGRVVMKGDRDPATEVDYAVEDEVRRYLRAMAPDVAFLGEEGGHSGRSDAEFTWALDPIDGTVNFMHGLPLCAVSLALISGSRPVLGVVDVPFLDLHYSAVAGGGAFRGSQQVSPAPLQSLGSAVVAVGDYAVGVGSVEKNADRIRITQRLAENVERVRMFGSAAIDLVWVAEGRIGASVMLSNNPWDTAAGVLIARESGANVVDRHGRPHGLHSESVVAVAPGIMAALLPLLDDL